MRTKTHSDTHPVGEGRQDGIASGTQKDELRLMDNILPVMCKCERCTLGNIAGIHSATGFKRGRKFGTTHVIVQGANG